ncbi:LOW QUALITY PROTEIN: nephrin-like [Pollicipes pollicipes]|uniref:LOW QUALITY PROTEIN: nephrin-like n=1 Tax=Pollicipes pollicipes TaxID=41117 RepID=UPI001884EEA2|nr:LOW QUALITY PROTEIN: nephrin-like [Pollicipes pollicipes]
MLNVPVVLVAMWTSLHPVLGQQQRFRVRPSNTSVIEGESVTLRCEVDHQAGRPQWAKDGFAMGYERSLPGFPRYQVLGDAGSGVHDLEVTNATLEDDAWFQCQVSPSQGQPAIRAAAFLTVLLKPLSVLVTSSARTPRPDVYEVREGSSLTLQCDVTEAKPAATVQWQRNGAIFRPDQEVTFSEPDSPERNDTSSSITLQPTHVDNGAGYSCLARHPAVRPAEQHLYNATVTLSVLYAPGPPEIVGYEEDEVVRMGEKKTLSCISRAGNPLAELVWFKNDEPITYQYRTIRGRAISEYSFKAEASDLHAIYRCEASSIVHPQPMVTSVQMNVQFGPETVEVTGTEEAKRGEPVELSCTTSSSNPPANITWVINGRTVTNTSHIIESHPDGGWVSKSNASSVVPDTMREDMVVSCYALNPALGLTEVGTLKVTVLYPPKRPRILGYVPGTHLRAGQRVSLSCVAQGGSPPASLSWYKGDDEREAETSEEDGVARGVITFAVDFTDNEAVFRCDSTNPAMDKPHSTNVTLLVYYPPASLKLKAKPKSLAAGMRAVLTCESRPSNPAANLTWWRDSELVTRGVARLTSKPAGDHGGFSSRVRLRKRLKWTDDQAVYTCRSQQAVLPGNMHDAITLHVAFAPVFPEPSATEDIHAGDSRLLNFTARASPDNITYSWYRGAAALPAEEARVVGLGALLNISQVEKSDAGWYRLEAENTEGTSTMRVNVNVQYEPEVTAISRELLVAPGETAQLECVADANPTTDDMITWHRDDFSFDSNKTKTFYSNGTSYLSVYGAELADIGEFLCQVDNGLGEVNATAGLLVQHAPEIDTSPQHLKAAAEKGDTARVTCRARGAPNVTFEWSRQGVVIDETTDAEKHQLEYTRVDLVTWQSVLKVVSVVTADYGEYVCVARNELGFQRQPIVLGGTTSPDPPLELHALNVTHDSVLLTWTPGFDGGLIQRYRVRYTRQVGPERFSYDDVQPENATTFRVELLYPNTEYSFAVMAFNERGESGYTKDVVKAKTADGPGVKYVPDDDYASETLSRVAIAMVTVAGAILLVINVVLMSCYVRRRRLIRKAASSAVSTGSETLQMSGGESLRSASTAADDTYSDDGDDDTSSDQEHDSYSGRRSSRAALSDGRPVSPASNGYGRTVRRTPYAYDAGYDGRGGTHPSAVPTPDLVPPGGLGRRYGEQHYPPPGGPSDWVNTYGRTQLPGSRRVATPASSIRGNVDFEQRGHLV